MPISQRNDLFLGKSVQNAIGGNSIDAGYSGYLLMRIGNDRAGPLVIRIEQISHPFTALPKMGTENIFMKQDDTAKHM